MKKMIVAVLAVAVLATSGIAMAQGWGRGPGMGMGYGPCSSGYGPQGFGPGTPMAGLNLTPEQNQKMNAMREGFFKETIPLRNDLMAKQLEMRTLWSQTTPDQEKILAKQKEINALRAQMQEKATKHRLEMRQILTPDQQAKLQDFPGGLGMMGPGHGMRGGRGSGMGPGGCPRW
jgi:Spy/CpxP family protein refolding chaperone